MWYSVCGYINSCQTVFWIDSLMTDRWLKEQFILADNGGKGRLNEKEVLTVMKQLNEQIPESIIKLKFKVSDCLFVLHTLPPSP